MSSVTGPSPVICANPDCRVATTGKCVEGRDVSVCPDYGREPDPETQEPDDDTEHVEAGLRLPGADTLDFEGATRVLRGSEACVVAVIGPKDAGKTSLIAGLYDLFQEGPVAGIGFARSETLHAFELACHDARTASRRGQPDMERTGLGEARFYHLHLNDHRSSRNCALLVADRAGEEYRLAADAAPLDASFPEVDRADAVTVLVDGKRLADIRERHNLRSELLMMLRALKDVNAFHKRQHLLLVLTKLDHVLDSPGRERAIADLASLAGAVERVVGGAFASVSTYNVAASPTSKVVPRGTGVGDVLLAWMRPADVTSGRVHPAGMPPRVFSRIEVQVEGHEDG